MLKMEHPSITDPAFLVLDRERQNEILSDLVRNKEILDVLCTSLQAFPWNPEEPRYQDLWLGLSALVLFENRIDSKLLLPHLRVFLTQIDRYRSDVPEPDADDIEPVEDVWGGLGLDDVTPDTVGKYFPDLYEQIILQAGPRDWERAIGFVQAVGRMSKLLNSEWQYKLASIAASIVLSSRPNRKAMDMWRDIWNRTSYHASDLFYHDSRLRRALLDENVDHAYRLMTVLAKAGHKSSDLVAGVIRAGYDVDFQDERASLGLFVGASGLLEASPLISPDLFRLGVAKLIWDFSHENKRTHERIFYDEISLIKSREILIDFRKALLRSDFIQSWGFAEYAFVHGFEPLELFDELSRLSPSFYEGGEGLMWAWKHLAAVESLLKLLPEDFGIYVMAHTVRLLARTPKDAELLDPFPDEEQ